MEGYWSTPLHTLRTLSDLVLQGVRVGGGGVGGLDQGCKLFLGYIQSN